MRLKSFVLACALCAAVVVPIWAQDTPATGGPGMMTPEMRQRMMSMMQDYLVMSQNTAISTPQGIVVLQGNRLLLYRNSDLKLMNTLQLPVPAMPAATEAAGAMPNRPLRGMVSAKILMLPNDEILVIRGQQLVKVNRGLTAATQTASLPDLPPLTTAELSIVSPLAAQIAMMPMMMMGMPGMAAGMNPPVATTPPMGRGAGAEEENK